MNFLKQKKLNEKDVNRKDLLILQDLLTRIIKQYGDNKNITFEQLLREFENKLENSISLETIK